MRPPEVPPKVGGGSFPRRPRRDIPVPSASPQSPGPPLLFLLFGCSSGLGGWCLGLVPALPVTLLGDPGQALAHVRPFPQGAGYIPQPQRPEGPWARRSLTPASAPCEGGTTPLGPTGAGALPRAPGQATAEPRLSPNRQMPSHTPHWGFRSPSRRASRTLSTSAACPGPPLPGSPPSAIFLPWPPRAA